MVLFTKEILIQLKDLHHIHVNVHEQQSYTSKGKFVKTQTWHVSIHGTLLNSPHEHFQTQVNLVSRAAAVKLCSELFKQVIDSGEVPALNTKLVEEVLLGKKVT